MTKVVRSWVVPSENLPMAVNCWGNPRGMLDISGVTDMAAKVTGDDGLLPHVVRDTAKDPRAKMIPKNLIFFIGTSPDKQVGLAYSRYLFVRTLIKTNRKTRDSYR